MNNRSVRERLRAIPLMLQVLKSRPGADAKDSPYSLLISYGYYEADWFSAEELSGWLQSDPNDSALDAPLKLSELMTWNSWFALHPEKICGTEVRVSSRDFPVAIQGSSDDVVRTIRAGLTAKPTDKTKKIKLMSFKAKAILILQEQERERNQSTDRLGFLGTLKKRSKKNGLSGLGELGVLPALTSQAIADNAVAINALLTKQSSGRKYKKGDTLSFEDIVASYNPGLSRDELVAWVWYKRSIGVAMSGWDKYFIKGIVASADRQVVTKPKASGHFIEVRDNHFRVIGKVEPNTVLGSATKKKLRYDKNTTYLIVKLSSARFDGFPSGSLVYVNEADVVVDKAADNVDESELKRLVEAGHLFYNNGRLVPYPIYAYGNMYDRELQLNVDQRIIVEKFGETVALAHRHIIQQAKPRIISVQNADPRERPKILAISDFATSHVIFDLREDAGVDLQKIARTIAEQNAGRRMSKAEREQIEAMKGRHNEETDRYEYTLQDAFRLWLSNLPKTDFKEVNAYTIIYYYLDNHVLSKSLTDEQKDTIGKYAPQECEELFSRFLNEALVYEDQQKVDFSWNRVFNAYSSIPHHRVPVGFSCSAYFKRSLLQFSPAQREAIAFMEIAGSGCLAYDVGVGKTMSAIITLANSLYSGKCVRPLIAVPNPTYAKWIRELVGYEDPASKEFIPGVLSYTGVSINDWSNLGVDALKKVKLDKAVPAKSITIVTFEGLMKFGYGQKVMDNLFDELAKILAQARNNDKSNRDLEKIYQKWRAMVGVSNKGSVADIDKLRFDYLVIDEAHNFKNIFDQVPTDEAGRKRYKISGSQSDRGIKAFFLANYVQRTFGQNVMLLTATPFTNSPLEIFSMLSLIGYNSLKDMGITSLETFCETFVLQSLEYVNNYKGEIVLDNVVKSYNNRLVLQRLIHNHIAYKTGEEAGVKRPVKINLPRLMAQQADGSFKKLGPSEQIVTYLKPNASQIYNQGLIEAAADVKGFKALAAIGRALGQNLDNALSPYLYEHNMDEAPTYVEYVENSPKIYYAVQCIASVKAWHKENGSECSGQVIYMNRGKDYFPMVKEYLVKETGFKLNVKFQNRTFDEVEFITSEVSADRKENIKDAFLAGVVKVIIGTATIKEGIDLQTKGTVLYNLYPDWNPTDIKQLEGRIWRQGNEFGYVRVVMPLVQNTMDVFVFQKLEEKTARINDIWYRADRGNVLDQESLDPMEIKFALFSNVNALVSVKVDQIKRELSRRLGLVKGNIEALGKFTIALSVYNNYQARCRGWVQTSLVGVNRMLDNWSYYKASNFYQLPLVRAMETRKQIELYDELLEFQVELQKFLSSTELSDKELIRLLDRAGRVNEKTEGKTSNYYAVASDLSEFRQKLSEVRKTERTILTPKGLTIQDDFSGLLIEYESEKKAIELETSELSNPENLLRMAEEIQAAKAKNSIDGGIPEQRAEDFAKLNYLLGYKAADVAADATGLPTDATQPKAKANEPSRADNPDKAKKIKILKLKAKAILILQEQEREQFSESSRQAA